MIKEKVKGYNSNLSNEIHIRLRQLSFVCEKLLCYEKLVTRPTSTIEEAHKLTRFFDEGIVFTEAFYFIAWRIIYITNYNIKPLPYLQGLKEKAEGVVLVRNCLIEHPEKTKEKIFMLSYGWGKDGPTLKNARPAGQTFEIKDRGFWINAKEFKDGIEELLQNAIKQ
jgi:hypothetical protein